MSLVLGIDAAWTDRAPSGVALVSVTGGVGRVLLAAPSQEEFLAAARGEAVSWGKPTGGPLDPERLLDAVAEYGGGEPAAVAVDMPLALHPVVGRRASDNAVSRRYGAAKCSTHSALPDRPGPVSDRLRESLARRGLPLRTAATAPGTTPALLEVYPHVALLSLCDLEERLPYKVSRSGSYWPGTTVGDRIERLLAQWRRLVAALERELGALPVALPDPREVRTLSALKAYEDGLDAVVCAWMGARYLAGRARGLGDGASAIWVPDDGDSPERKTPDQARA